MAKKMIKTLAATTLALPLLVGLAPAAGAVSTPAPAATSASAPAASPVGHGGGSVFLCFPLGSVTFCI